MVKGNIYVFFKGVSATQHTVTARKRPRWALAYPSREINDTMWLQIVDKGVRCEDTLELVLFCLDSICVGVYCFILRVLCLVSCVPVKCLRCFCLCVLRTSHLVPPLVPVRLSCVHLISIPAVSSCLVCKWMTLCIFLLTRVFALVFLDCTIMDYGVTLLLV